MQANSNLDRLNKILQGIRNEDDVPNVGNREYREEYQKEILREKRLKNDAQEEANRGDTQDRDQRKDFAEKIYNFAAVYMVFVFLMLFLSGCVNNGFQLSDSVLVTLLRTTTANVIGILAIVVTYLFSRKRK